jgi:translation initiation factor SUI1
METPIDIFKNAGKIHIWFKQFSKRRCITTIEGLDSDLDLDKICRHMQRAFSCSATVIEDKVIQLQGDHRQTIPVWLVEKEVLTEKEAKDRIVTHG